MDLKAMLTAFGLVFLAELGDKTQLATLLLASQSRSALSVFLGAAIALVLTSLIGVVLGSYLAKAVPAHYLQIGAGLAFIVLGAVLLIGKS